jgi:hypothetical protein
MLNPESARDIVRELLHFMDPIKFPAGAALTSLSDLFTAMASQTLYGRVFTKCNTCGYEEMGMREVFGQVQEIVISSHLDSLYPSGMGINKWYNEIFNQYKKSCIQCSANGIFNQMLTSTKLHQVPPIMFIGINSTNLLLEDILVFRGLNGIEHLQLRGLIYHSQIALHYTCIVVDKYGGLWRHDSMIHKRRTLYLGNLSMILDRKVLHHIGMEIKLCAAIYVRC